MPKTDPNGNPCQFYLGKQELQNSTIIGPPWFKLNTSPPGTCIVEQILTNNNLFNPLINNGVSVTKQTSSGNVNPN